MTAPNVGDDVPVSAPSTAAVAAARRDHTLALDNTKAGMGTVDKVTVERIINEASEGSKFYLNEQRKAVARQKRLERAQAKLAAFDAGQVEKLPLVRRCAEIEMTAQRQTRLGQYIHFDMDAFYASVEELLNPALKGVPFGVGGMGMLCTSNYEARKYGVRAGMPGYIAKKLCPHLLFAWSGHRLYRWYSDIFKGIVAEYDPEFSSHGLDELTMNAEPFLAKQAAKLSLPRRGDEVPSTGPTAAFVDAHRTGPPPAAVTERDLDRWEQEDEHPQKASEEGRQPAAADAAALSPRPSLVVVAVDGLPAHADDSLCVTIEQLSWEIRARVYAATRLTASAGIAPTPALSKILSNFEKPDGQSILRATTLEDLKAFMHSQSVRTIAGVGRVTDELLSGLGYKTCAEFYHDRVRLCHALTPKNFEFLLCATLGCQGSFEGFTGKGEEGASGDDAHDDGPGRKSVGAERTFGTMATLDQFMLKAEDIFDKAYESLLDESLCSAQVGLKLKRKSFEVAQTTANLTLPTDERAELWSAFESLLLPHARSYADFRLLGCRFTGLKKKGDHCEPTALYAAAAKRDKQPTLAEAFKRSARAATTPKPASTASPSAQRWRSQPPPRMELVLSSSSSDSLNSTSVVVLSDDDAC